jgi:hypothetical protein
MVYPTPIANAIEIFLQNPRRTNHNGRGYPPVFPEWLTY